VALRLDREQRNFRTKLWTLCMLTSQRVNNYRGLPPLVLADTYSHEGYKDDPFVGLPAPVLFQRKLSQAQSEAVLRIERDALSRQPEVRNVVLGPAINYALSQLVMLAGDCPSKLDLFFLRSAQLQISACHLIAPSSAISDVDLVTMYSDACCLIESATELDEEQELAEYGPTATGMMLNLAASIVLRVGRSHVSGQVDSKRGQKCYFLVIRLHKKHSVRSDDVVARATIILSQLWTSKLVVRQPDGTPDSLWLRCRSRLGLSLMYDCLWLWRQEFGGQPSPYDGVEDEVANSTGQVASDAGQGLDAINLLGAGWTPETLFQDFQWPLFDEFAYDNTNNWQMMAGGDVQPVLPR